MALPCVPASPPSPREDRGYLSDRCPGSFPAGQVAAEASEAEDQCGSLKMDALIVKLLQLQRDAAWRAESPARWGQWRVTSPSSWRYKWTAGVGWSQRGFRDALGTIGS